MKTNQTTTTRYSVASQMAFDVLIDALDIVVDEPSLSQQGHGLGSDGPQICLITAKGQTGFAQTSTRLLGFSSELRRWTDVQLGAEERVERHQVLPRLAVVQTSRGLYGFQEARGHWTNESLGTNEHAKQVHGRGHALVVITTERVLVFSSFTGGFFSLPWSTDERVLSVDDTNDAVMVRTSARLLAFRSQTTEWVEVR